MDTPGKRVYAIRLALGDGWKTPMTMAAFAALLTRKSGSAYDSAKVSRMESGDRNITIPEADLLASVDPLKRGRAWVAWGDGAAPSFQLDPTVDDRVPDEEVSEEIAREAARKPGAREQAANGHRKRR